MTADIIKLTILVFGDKSWQEVLDRLFLEHLFQI